MAIASGHTAHWWRNRGQRLSSGRLVGFNLLILDRLGVWVVPLLCLRPDGLLPRLTAPAGLSSRI